MLPAERLNRILLLRQAFCIWLSVSLVFFCSQSFLPLLRPRSLTFSPVYPAGGKDKRPSAGRVPGKFFLSAYVTRRAFPFVFLTLQSAYFHTPPFLFLFSSVFFSFLLFPRAFDFLFLMHQPAIRSVVDT